ncbi:MAG: hypothetical protein ACREV1_07910 [Gammaproteobacteria bacterium]
MPTSYLARAAEQSVQEPEELEVIVVTARKREDADMRAMLHEAGFVDVWIQNGAAGQLVTASAAGKRRDG